MAKFVYGKPAVKRLTAGGDYTDDWFDVKDGIAQGDLLAAVAAATDHERGMRMAYALIGAWSLTDAAGKAVPVSWEAFCTLPLDMAAPLYDEIKNASFLARTSLLTSPESSPS